MSKAVDATAAYHASRAINIYRARYLDSKFQDEDSAEKWQDASALYFNLTGKDHPQASYASFDED